jgi:hypothetical protein
MPVKIAPVLNRICVFVASQPSIFSHTLSLKSIGLWFSQVHMRSCDPAHRNTYIRVLPCACAGLMGITYPITPVIWNHSGSRLAHSFLPFNLCYRIQYTKSTQIPHQFSAACACSYIACTNVLFAESIRKTNSMAQSLYWNVSSCSADQEIPRFLCNSKVHYRVHKNKPLGPALNQLNPVHILKYCFCKTCFNIILRYIVILSLQICQRRVFINFSASHASYMPCPFHPPWFDHSKCKLWILIM